MARVELQLEKQAEFKIDESVIFLSNLKLLEGKRKLTNTEIETLVKNQNRSSDSTWSNVYVDKEFFDPELIHRSEFQGLVVLGKLQRGTLKYNDLSLQIGIYQSLICSCVLGDYVVIRNVNYLCNYSIGNRVVLFNVEEISCTTHSKFGNGLLKDGEPESRRIWIEAGNENGGRRILPFENMIAADAYLWSSYRADDRLQKRFIELTEFGVDSSSATFGTIGDDAVIKNTLLIKDAKIGACAYIKGAMKLKNITICSSIEEPSQIGEGVELVNGIVGFKCNIFYQAVAIRFVIGRNCQLKYGARLLNSVLGDNSTVSCCELLNNLIYPFHEQHHNTSFLIAATIQGQSNVAAGATIGSNHNSRSPDGEIFAGRGFWPGLCSDFKHNSRFASFCLVAKGSYPHELNITYPFSLVSSNGVHKPVSITPAYWFNHNMFAIARNNYKFKSRDKRINKVQRIESDCFAPDTIQEVYNAIERIIYLTATHIEQSFTEEQFSTVDARLQHAKDYLCQNPNGNFTLHDDNAMKKHGATICKPSVAYREYRSVIKYFATKSIMVYLDCVGVKTFDVESLKLLKERALYTVWENVGGQVIPQERVAKLLDEIASTKITNWLAVHTYYEECNNEYIKDKARYAIYLLEYLYSMPIEQFTSSTSEDIFQDVLLVSNKIYEDSVRSRQKDYDDSFRQITYRNQDEMLNVVGRIEDNSFLKQLSEETESFNLAIKSFFLQ